MRTLQILMVAACSFTGCATPHTGMGLRNVLEGILVTPGTRVEAEDGSFVFEPNQVFTSPFQSGHFYNRWINSDYEKDPGMYKKAISSGKLVRVTYPGRGPLYGLLLLNMVPENAFGPGARSYRIEIPDHYVETATGGRVSVVYERVDYLKAPQVKDWGFGWILWLSDRPLVPLEENTELLAGWRSEWQGFGPGSFVRYMEQYRDGSKTERLITVLEATDRFVKLQEQTTVPEGATRPFPKDVNRTYTIGFGAPINLRLKSRRDPSESLDVAGRRFDCSRFSLNAGFQIDSLPEVTLWKSPDAPCWSLKRRYVTRLNSGTSVTEFDQLHEVQALDSEETVGSRKIKCVVERQTMHSRGPSSESRSVNSVWLSPEVPGGVVKHRNDERKGGTGNPMQERTLLEFAVR